MKNADIYFIFVFWLYRTDFVIYIKTQLFV